MTGSAAEQTYIVVATAAKKSPKRPLKELRSQPQKLIERP
jgi:hypothetical protein